MKKGIFRSLWTKVCVAAAIFIPLVSVLSCDIGLGEAVDVSAPTLTITYPPSGAVIRDSFVLAGECNDDVLVTSVNVRVVNTTVGNEVYKGNAVISGKSWQITLNDRDDSAYAGTNGWQYADGTYEITAWANDNSGKSSGVSSRSVDVDNTAPFFIISKPGVTASAVEAHTSEPAAYGSTFTVTGTIADLHEISKMALDVYDGAGNLITNSSSAQQAENIYETSIPTAGGTSVEFANTTRAANAEGPANSSDPMAYQRYVTLYGNVENKIETKHYKCTVRLTDAARVYKTPGDNGAGEGNITSQVYLYDEVYTSYLSSSKGLGLSASNLMNISNGNQVHDKLSMNDLKAKAVDTADFGGIDNRLSFTLNPAANPTYTLSGLEIYKSEGLFGDNQLANTSNVTATVSAGLNDTAIFPKTITVWVKDMTSDVEDGALPPPFSKDAAKEFIDSLNYIVSIKHQLLDNDPSYTYDQFKAEVKAYLDPNGKNNVWCVKDNSTSGASSGTLITVPFAMSEEAGDFLKVNHYYIIALAGYDQDGLEFAQAKYYGFKATGTGKLPEIKVLSPANLSLVKTSAKKNESNNGLTFSGTAKNGDSQIDYIKVTVNVTDENTNALVGSIEKTIVIDKNYPRNSDGSLDWSFSPADCDGYEAVKCEEGKAYLYSADFIVHEITNSSSSVNSTIHVDTVKPVVTITSLTPVISDYGTGDNEGKSYVNGKITVKGNVEETNLDKVTIEYYKDSISEGNRVVKVSKNKVFSFNDVFDTALHIINNRVPSDAKKLIVKVIAEDKVGNVGFTTSTVYNHETMGRPENEEIIVDQVSDKPKIKPSNFEDVADFTDVKAGKNLFGILSNNQMKFSVEDDDGTIAQENIFAYVDNVTTVNRYANGYVYLGAHDSLTALPEGTHTVKIIARDSGWQISDENSPNSFVAKDYKVVVSAGAPTIGFKADNNSYKNGSQVTVYGTISNLSSSDVVVTLSKPNGGTENITVPHRLDNGKAGTKDFTDTITVSSDSDKETKTETYTLVDGYGQQSSEKFSYVVDNKAPTVVISSVTPTVDNGSNVKSVNGKIKVAFNASDNYDLSKVEYFCYSTGYADDFNFDNGVVKSNTNGPTLDPVLGLSGTYSEETRFGTTFELDTTKISDDTTPAKMLLVLKATDKAGSESYATSKYIVDQKSDKPQIKPSNFENVSNYTDIQLGKNLFGTDSNNTMKFAVEDDDGTVSNIVAYVKGDENKTNRYANGYVYLAANGALRALAEGEYTIVIEAKDSIWASSIDTFNSISTEYKIAISSGAPAITFDDATKSYKKGDSFTVTGKIINHSASEATVTLKQDNSIVGNYTVPARSGDTDGTKSFDFNVTVDSDKEKETKTLTYSLIDKYGQQSTEKFSYIIDNKKPTINVSSVTPKVENGSDPYFVNGKINVTFNASDNYDLDKVRYLCYVAAPAANLSFDNGKVTDSSGNELTPSDETGLSYEYGYADEKRFGTTFEIDTTKISDDTTKRKLFLVLSAADKAGNVGYTTNTYIVNQESDKPQIKPSNFENVSDFAGIQLGKNLFGTDSNNTMKFAVEDDDGTVSNITAYVKGDSSKTNRYANGYVYLGAYGAFSALAEGEYTIVIEAKDSIWASDSNIYNSTSSEYKIAISSGAPTITFTADDKSYKKGATVNVKGEIKNTSTTKAIVKLSKAGNAPNAIEIPAHALVNGVETDGIYLINDPIEVTSDKDKDSVTVTYSLVDKYGQSSSEKFSYVVDNKAPTVNISSVTPRVENKDNADIPYVNGNISVVFNASDNYDLDKVEYTCYEAAANQDISFSSGTVTNGTKCTADGLSGIYGNTEEKRFGTTFVIDTTKISNNSTKKNLLLVLTATDKAGNVTYAVKKYIVDQETDRPVVNPTNFVALANGAKGINSLANGNLFGVSSNNKLMGSIEDDDGIKTVTMYYRKALSYENVGSTPAEINGSATFDGEYTSVSIISDGTSTTANLSQNLPTVEGKYEIYFVAEDTNFANADTTPFNRYESSKYYVGVSSGSPVISLAALANDGYTKSYSNGAATLAVSGTASKHDLIRSVIRTSGSDVRDDTVEVKKNTLTKDADTGNAKFSDTLQPLTTSKTVEYKVTDIFGQTATASVNYIVDDVKPSFVDDKLLIQNVAYTSGKWYRNSDISIEGDFYDAGAGIKEISYTLEPHSDSVSGTGTIVATANSSIKDGSGNVIPGYYKFKGTISGVLAGSNNILKIKTTDSCGNISEEKTITLMMDETAPQYTANFISVDNGKTSSSATGTVTVNGKQKVTLYGKISDISQSGIGLLDAGKLKAIVYKINGTEVECTTTFTKSTGDLTKWDEAKGAAYYEYDETELGDKTSIRGWKTEIAADKAVTGTLTAECVDIAGNKFQNPSVLMFQVDDEAPKVTIRTSSTGVNGSAESIEGSVTENFSLAGMDLYYATGSLPETNAKDIYDDTTKDLKDYGWTRFTTSTVTDIAQIYSWKFDKFNFNEYSGATASGANGIGTVYILPVVKDKAGNSSAYKKTGEGASATYSWNATEFTVDMNKDRPTVQATNLTRNGAGPYTYILKYGTNAQISGTVSDDDATSSNTVQLILGSKKQITSVEKSGTSAYKATFADGSTATFTEATSGSTITWTSNADAYTDPKTNVKSYEKTTLTGTDWTYTPADPSDGQKSVYFYVMDNRGGVFYTGNESGDLYKPYFQYKSETAENSIAALSYGSDCNSPEVSSVKIISYSSDADDAAAVSKDPIGSTLIEGGVSRRYIKFEILGSDANQIDGFTLEAKDSKSGTPNSVKYWMGNVPSDARSGLTENGNIAVDSSDNRRSTWTTGLIDLNSDTEADKWRTGEVSVTVNVYDKSGLKGNGSYTFNVDNSAPEIKNITPLSTDEKTGKFDVSGDASDADTGRSGLASLTYYVPTIENASKTDGELAALDVWQAKSAVMDKWVFTFNGGNTTYDCPLFSDFTAVDDSNNPIYGTPDANNVWTIPVYIKAVDALGNYSIARHSIKYNPDGDKPRTEFTYPTNAQYQKDSDGDALGYVTLGSTIRVTGTVTIPNIDCKAVSDGVYVQIATEVIKAKKALTLYKAKKTLKIGELEIKSGDYIKASKISSLTLGDDYETESVVSDAVLTTAQAAVLTENEDYIHAEDWAGAKTVCSDSLGYTVVDADSINTNDAEKVNISAWPTGTETNNTGFTTKENRTAWWGIPAQSTTSSWVIAINQRNELNPTENGTTNNIAIRACSVNNAGKAGGWSETYYIHIDDSAPVMNVKLRQYDVASPNGETLSGATPTVEKDYVPGMYLKGNWYIYLEVIDESGIVSGDNGIVVADGKTFYKYAYQYNSKNCYKVWIPVSGTEGNLLQYKVSATDTDEGNPHTVTNTYQLYLDNTAPEFGTITSTTSGKNSFVPAGDTRVMSEYKIKDSNKSFNIASPVTETGSGFERTVFYLIRKKTGAAYTIKNDSVQSIFDPFSLDSSKRPVGAKVATSDLTEVKVKQGSSEYSLWGKTISGTQRDNDVTYNNRFYSSDISGNTHIRQGGLIYIGNLLRRIEKVDATNGYVEFDEDTNGGATSAVFIYAQVVDNATTEGGSPSADNYGFTFTETDDGDGMPEKVDVTSSGVKWNADIRSANLSDGPVTLVVMAFDKAGNVSCKEIDTSVANNAPRIAKVFLGTDIDGNSRYDANEFVEYNWSVNEFGQVQTDKYTDAMTLRTKDYVNGKKSVNSSGAGNGKSFIIKNGLAVVPEIVGGNIGSGGSIGMVYNRSATAATSSAGTAADPKVNDASTTYYTLPSTAELTDTANSFYGYTLSNLEISGKTQAEFNAITKDTAATINGTGKGMSFTFWDETEEGVKGSSTQSAVLYVEDFDVDLIDVNAPSAVIHPFHWNSKSDNSIKKDANGNLLGHIELEDDLSDALKTADWGDGTAGKPVDPKISGKVVITGYAYDETRLGKITIAETTNKFTLTNCYSEYKNTDGTVAWTSASGTGWTLTVTNKSAPSQEGHLAQWTLEIDSEKVSGVACKDIKFTVTAEDATILAAKNASTPGTTQTSRSKQSDGKYYYATAAQYELGKLYDSVAAAVAGTTVSADATTHDKIYVQGPADGTNTNVYAYYRGTTGYYQMDVVPYVTKVTTGLSGKLKTSVRNAYSRTATGHYIVGEGEDITFDGFNLNGAKFVKTEADATSGIGEATVDLTSGKLTATAANLPKSRDYRLKVGDVYTINNINNNAAKGSAPVGEITDSTSYEKKRDYAYNSKANDKGNKLLTDDVVIDVWQFDIDAAKPESGELREPIMKINPKSGKVGFAFVAGPAYASMAGGSTDYSYKLFQRNYATFSNISMAFDEAGNSYGTMTGLDTYPNGATNTLAGRFTFVTSKWGVDTDSMDDNYNPDKKLRLEAIGLPGNNLCYVKGVYPPSYTMTETRFASPSIVAVNHETNTSVYLAYYDSVQGQIRFRYTDNLAATKGTSDDFVDNTGINDTSGDKFKHVFESRTSKFSLIAGADWQNYATAENTATGLTKKVGTNYFYDTGYKAGKYVAIDVQKDAHIGIQNGTIQRLKDGIEVLEGQIIWDNHWEYKGESKDVANEMKEKYKGKDLYLLNSRLEKIAEMTFNAWPQDHDEYYRNAFTETPSADVVAQNPKYVVLKSDAQFEDVPKYNSYGDVVVAVWYDGKDCRYAFNDNPTSGLDNGVGGGWKGNKVIFSDGGKFCNVKVGPDGSIHIAANVDGTLKYAYLSSYDAAYTESSDSVLIDGYGDSGDQITIDVGQKRNSNGAYVVVPHIGYYQGSCSRPAVAELLIPENGTMNYKLAGADSDGYFTGNWEVSIVPTPSELSDAVATTDKINIGLWKKDINGTKGVVTTSADTVFTANASDTSNNSGTGSNGNCYGNGTINPILGYAVKDSTGSYLTVIETAQKK
ncbi:hypothetical protein [Treponema sp.]|uniref:hypothetical protein n=1 Tax=Treponema sp. TaxID=166 RepID=UPI00298EA94D|nr:hypothetical protein [Treponema sp.]MCQ2241773.1 hypothetical protein [Treponema sp.]